MDDVIEGFAGLCDRAAEHGLLVACLSPPVSGIPDVATVWRIVDAAGRAERRPPRRHVAPLARRHRRRCAACGPRRPCLRRPGQRRTGRARGSLHGGHHAAPPAPGRRRPRSGRFLRTLEAMGVDCPISVELFNPEFQALPADQAAHPGLRRHPRAYRRRPQVTPSPSGFAGNRGYRRKTSQPGESVSVARARPPRRCPCRRGRRRAGRAPARPGCCA